MQHKILLKQYLGSSRYRVGVELLPANEAENLAILRVERAQANETERELVNNYLLFSLGELGDYSVVSLTHQQGRQFQLTVVV